MARWQVVGTVTFNFDVDVEAESEEEAEDKVDAMSYSELVGNASIQDVDVDGVTELDGKVAKK